ncbi:MAG: endonuclease/exonuclease/phosphatase family protein [Flavobacteriales bacterium]|nr:endonuclease/exonuclease/phosphatase family protein [Flavobacteriales bacterium]
MLKNLGFFRWVWLIIHTVFSILLIGSMISPIFKPFEYWYIAFLGINHVLLLFINLFFTLSWLLLRPLLAIPFIIVILSGVSLHQRSFPLHFKNEKPGKDAIKIMSWNVQLFKLYNWTHNKQLRDEMIEFISNENPDILCLQEYFQASGDYFETTKILKNKLDAKNIHFSKGVSNNVGHEFGIATFSRFPIINTGSIFFNEEKNKTNLAQYTDILWNNDTIRIYNIHLASNHLNTQEVDEIMEANNKSWIITRKWISKLRNGYKHRQNQIIKVRKHMDQSPHPVLVCGDMNDVPVSYTYKIISNGLTDAFVNSGNGLGATYNGRLPYLRIDYIFHDNSIRSTSFDVIYKPFTDHFPIRCWIEQLNQ